MNAEQQERFDGILADYLRAVDAGRAPDRDGLLAAHPDLAEELAATIDDGQRLAQLATRTVHDTGQVAGRPTGDGDDEELPIGSLLGPYRLDEVIGRGGMGIIYRATHQGLQREVAIKVLSARLGRDPDLVKRFQREGRALARLEHPHIVRVHDMGSQAERHYLVMELVRGVTLRKLMETDELTSERALALVPKICDALEYAHEQGVIHRDIKPENILITLAGEPKVADFGLAKVLLGETSLGNLTRTEVVMGTYNYMAPEQKRTAAVDHRADVYAVGVVLYEMLTGKLPMGNFARPSQAATVDSRIDEIVLKALAAEPDERYQRASQLAGDVGGVLSTPAPPAAGALPPDGRDGVRARAVDVVVMPSEEGLGGGLVHGLRIVLKSGSDLDVRTWGRPEVGLALESRKKAPKLIETDPGTPAPWLGVEQPRLLEIKLPKGDHDLTVPADLPLQIVAVDSDVTVTGLSAVLDLPAAEGDATIRDHSGPLTVERLDDGAITVQGLRSHAYQLRTREGDLTVNALCQRGGAGLIHSDEGNVHVGLTSSGNAFAYEAQTLSGRVDVRMENTTSRSDQLVQGVVGEPGDGELRVESYSGRVNLGDQQDIARRIEVAGALKDSWYYFVGAAWLFFFTGMDWIPWMLVGFGVWGILKRLWPVYHRVRWNG